MEVTRQLYQLQELDNEIEQDEQSLKLKGAQLGDRRALDAELYFFAALAFRVGLQF